MADVLRPGVFLERHDGEDDQMLGTNLRYAHNGDAVRPGAGCSFEIIDVAGKQSGGIAGRGAGLLFVARKPEAGLDAPVLDGIEAVLDVPLIN